MLLHDTAHVMPYTFMQALINAWLGPEQPRHWLLIAAEDRPAMVSIEPLENAPECCSCAQILAGDHARPHYAAAVVINPPPAAHSTQLLARLRDQLAARVLVLTAPPVDLPNTELMALGYCHLPDQGRWVVHEFDLHHYKERPDWLNADHWSNPQRWDKERW